MVSKAGYIPKLRVSVRLNAGLCPNITETPDWRMLAIPKNPCFSTRERWTKYSNCMTYYKYPVNRCQRNSSLPARISIAVANQFAIIVYTGSGSAAARSSARRNGQNANPHRN